MYTREASIIVRIETNGTGNSFITLKDNKEIFLNCPSTTLLNFPKNELGRTSKLRLQNINTTLSKKFGIKWSWKYRKPYKLVQKHLQ